MHSRSLTTGDVNLSNWTQWHKLILICSFTVLILAVLLSRFLYAFLVFATLSQNAGDFAIII
jgi:hypothetical protein